MPAGPGKAAVRGLVSIVARPRSKNPGVEVTDGVMYVRVREAPQDGAATEACRKALASALGVSVSAVTLVHGARSKRKTFAIEGMTQVALALKTPRRTTHKRDRGC